MILHGFPTAIVLSAISLVTTLPEPIITFLPILTPGFIVVPPPIQVPSPIYISLANSSPNFL